MITIATAMDVGLTVVNVCVSRRQVAPYPFACFIHGLETGRLDNETGLGGRCYNRVAPTDENMSIT